MSASRDARDAKDLEDFLKQMRSSAAEMEKSSKKTLSALENFNKAISASSNFLRRKMFPGVGENFQRLFRGNENYEYNQKREYRLGCQSSAYESAFIESGETRWKARVETMKEFGPEKKSGFISSTAGQILGAGALYKAGSIGKDIAAEFGKAFFPEARNFFSSLSAGKTSASRLEEEFAAAARLGVHYSPEEKRLRIEQEKQRYEREYADRNETQSIGGQIDIEKKANYLMNPADIRKDIRSQAGGAQEFLANTSADAAVFSALHLLNPFLTIYGGYKYFFGEPTAS